VTDLCVFVELNGYFNLKTLKIFKPAEEQMKRIYIIRHAKAEDARGSASDIDRQLTEEGIRDARSLGKLLFGLGMVPDIIISSPAKRNVMTAQNIARACKYHKEIQLEEDIYLGSTDAILGIIKKCSNDAAVAAVVGHSPTMEKLGSMLLAVGAIKIDMKRGSCLSIVFGTNDWKEIGPKNSMLEWLVNPELL